MDAPPWTLNDRERAVLAAALDALLPVEGSFPWPSEVGVIDDFILRQVPPAGTAPLPYPWIDAAGLRAILARLDGAPDMPAALTGLERERPADFRALWALAVYGYYSRPETIAAIQRELAPDYHGAPLPLGYAHIIEPWDPDDPLQLPREPRGSYIATEAVRRVDFNRRRRQEDDA